ncbi:MAG: tetratricopeptide repeat protein [Bdellovibrionales bacterium]|nr:tetratricopeptide repeat protein [Bdellovibrionales bacterium]
MKKHSKILVIIFVLLVSSITWANVEGKYSRVGDVLHMEFSGLKNWKYKLTKNSDNSFELVVPQLNRKSLIELTTVQIPFLKNIKVIGEGPDNSHIVRMEFSSNIIESFDYQTDEPSRLIVDFYEDVEKKAAQMKKAEEEKKALKKKKLEIQKKHKKIAKSSKSYKKIDSPERSPAGDEFLKMDEDGHKMGNLSSKLKQGVYDASDPDYDRFQIKDYEIKEEAIIASKQNIYIRFPMLKMGSSNLKKIEDNPPEYKIKPTDSRENKEARLLLTLYNKGRYSAFLKTYVYFIEKHPQSIYGEIVNYMAADVHYRLWKKTKDSYHYNTAKKIYRKTLLENPNSPLKERITLLLDYVELEQGKALETVQNFIRFIKEFPDSSEIDRAKHALAEGYFLLNKYDAALNVYEDLEKTAKQKEMGIEATYRRGDVFFKMKDFGKAIDEYLAAIKKYPKYESWFANAHYNLAESYFWTGEYKKSLDHYIRYLKLFPKDSHNSYAMTRIGEVLEILGADRSKIMGAFLESYFRFENTQGGKIARIRMLTQQMKSMNKKELNKTLEELNKISKSVNLPKMDEFTTLMITDGYRRRKDYDHAISQLIGYYQKNPTSVSLSFFKTRIVGNIADSINEKINNDNYFDALKINGRYGNTWLRNSDRIDIEYFKARAYELAGVYKEAHKNYIDVLKRLSSIKGTREHLIRKVSEHLPSIDRVHLRLANTSLNLREYSEAYNHLKDIEDTSKLTASEKIEVIEVSSKVYVEKGLINRAIENLKALVETWKDQPVLKSSAYLKLAELQLKTKDYRDAEMSADHVISDIKYDADKFSDQQKKLAKALEYKALALQSQGREMAAVQVYLDLLDKFDSKKPLGEIRYTAGEILFKKDDLKGAQKIWSAFNGKENEFYKQLADEKLKQLEWERNYKRYNDRIPAMSNFR